MKTKNEIGKHLAKSDLHQKMIKKRSAKLKQINRAVKKLGWTHNDILNSLADSWVCIEELGESNKALTQRLEETETLLHIFSGQLRKDNDSARKLLLEMCANDGVTAAQGLLAGIELHKRLHASTAGKERAEALHNKPGGSREKRDMIRAIWKTGKYDTKELCAEQEYAALNMSFSSARKALRRIEKPA